MRILVLIGLNLFVSLQLAFAADAPVCLSYGRDLPINNAQVLHWKRTTSNQFQERAHVKGPVVRIFSDRSNHRHFEINIGRNVEDVLEVIYNEDFGEMPLPAEGAIVEACGDYITATAKSGPYPPSPSGAIIHWVHLNPSGRGHDAGFVVIDGVLYGQDVSKAGPKPYPNPKKKKGRRGLLEGLEELLPDWFDESDEEATDFFEFDSFVQMPVVNE